MVSHDENNEGAETVSLEIDLDGDGVSDIAVSLPRRLWSKLLATVVAVWVACREMW